MLQGSGLHENGSLFKVIAMEKEGEASIKHKQGCGKECQTTIIIAASVSSTTAKPPTFCSQ
jgi:hypothetical protein